MPPEPWAADDYHFARTVLATSVLKYGYDRKAVAWIWSLPDDKIEKFWNLDYDDRQKILIKYDGLNWSMPDGE